METPTKDQLIQDLKKSFQQLINWINEQPESQFNEVILEGKWTIAGHLYHLIKTTKGVSQGMVMPKLGLKTMFGKNNRTERTFQEMADKYNATIIQQNVAAPGQFEAKADRTFVRPALISRFEEELNDFIKALDNWEEADMSIYVLPHPVIGKCTIREFIYFTIIHTDHHLETLTEKYVKVV